MSGLSLVTIAIIILSLSALVEMKVGAQQKRATFGPVVSAYLTGLTEELTELDYQLNHREISRTDYERSKQRLLILRRFVERYAMQRNEDLVPEFQVLTDDELRTLGLNPKPDPNKLQIGDVLDGQWKLLNIERSRIRFFIFERLAQPEKKIIEGVVSEGKRVRKIDPLEVIETIVVHEGPIQTRDPQLQQSGRPDGPSPITAQAGSSTTQRSRTSEQEPPLLSPRILHIYMPRYTEKARANGVEGELIVRALFQRDGRLKDVKVEKGLGFGLDQLAIDAVKRIGFQPAQFAGKDIDTHARIVFNFKLNKITVQIQSDGAATATKGGKP